MTLSEAYEALLKMPIRNRMPAFNEGGRIEKRDSASKEPDSEMLEEILPVKWPHFMTVITGGA